MSDSPLLPKVIPALEDEGPLPSIEGTMRFIQHAHAGQEYSPGVPYWHHPVAVMKRMPANATHDEKLAALLHDVLEDTPYTREQLLDMGYSQRTVDIVKAVGSAKAPQGLDDEAFIRWYRGSIQELADGTKRLGEDALGRPRMLSFDPETHRGALRVKLADNQENMAPEKLAVLPLEKYEWYGRKYAGVSQILKDGLRMVERSQELCSQR